MDGSRRLARLVHNARSNVWVHCALLVSFLGFGVLLSVLPATVVDVCLGVGVVGLLYHALLTAFERGRASRPWPLSWLPDWSLFALPAGGFVGVYVVSDGVTIVRLAVFGALLVVFFYFWFVLPAAWYHKVRYEDRDGEPDSPESSLSVLVPAYNEEACLGRCLDALTAARYPGEREVIVVDDGSTDATYEQALAHATDEVTVLRKSNGGKDSALNHALERATGDAIVTVDADSVVEPDALARIVSDLEESPEVGAVGGTVKLLHTDSLVEKLQALEYAVGINTFRRAFAVLGNVNVVPGCLGCFRREAIEEVGGYDDDTLTEDFDITIKLLRAGWLVRASEALSYTEAPATWRGLYRQRIRWSRGNIETLRKHSTVLRGHDGSNFSGIVFPYQVVSIVALPCATVLILGTIGVELLRGNVTYVVAALVLFTLLQVLASLFALVLDRSDLRLLLYAPVSVVWYKCFVDAITLKSLVDVARHTEQRWTRASRRPTAEDGGTETPEQRSRSVETEANDD